MIRQLIAASFAMAMLVAAAPNGQDLVCSGGGSACTGACGSHCYEPASGQTCTNGQICFGGSSACGCSCYEPARGQTCNHGSIEPSNYSRAGKSRPH